ncbi:hypothetical protein SAMN05216588_11232 [Pseudomonas flavescens]|uniref:Uncharacterized protein n=1 Tax=Phytopseudomonas flavescens TaxID=29435 RepID=A0A1G8IAY4_9GAMM|nr:hypothetical protein [Pseudomonas flavescens]SDI16158.1 hypothetical protein SAMN05216588_11232 [Pseudomonas flavescens]
MDAGELARRLEEAGCNPINYAIGTAHPANDALTLRHDGRRWTVQYSERGQDAAPLLRTADEAQACQFFFDAVMAMQHLHCVGFLRSTQRAEALAQRLLEAGLSPHCDQIPYGGKQDLRHRVFVTGQAVFDARRLLGDALPLTD